MDTDKVIFLSVVVITVLIVGIIAFSSVKKAPIPKNESVSLPVDDSGVPEILQNNPNIRGPENAVLTIVEFSDFQCPYCAQIQPIVLSILDKYPNDVRLVFKNFPLSFHEDAMPAALAAEAAAKQGHFSEYHDKLFENQPNYSDKELIGYANELNLDIDKFNKDRKSTEVSQKVKADLKLGQKMQIRGTPTFFFVYNGVIKQVSMTSGQDFISQVDDLVSSLKKDTEESTPSANIDN